MIMGPWNQVPVGVSASGEVISVGMQAIRLVVQELESLAG